MRKVDSTNETIQTIYKTRYINESRNEKEC